MKKTGILVTVLTAFAAAPAGADEVAPTVVSSGDSTIVYVFPTSPQTFIPVAGLPSFLVMPGGAVPPVATQVIYTTPGPALSSQLVAGVAVDCTSFEGTVAIAGADVFGLDRNGNGIGCELGERPQN